MEIGKAKVQLDTIGDELVVFISALGSLLINFDSMFHWIDVAICAAIGTGISYALKEFFKRNWETWFPKKNKDDNDKWDTPNRSGE